MSGAKMIVPSWFQLPPRAMEVSQMVSGGPPCASIFLSLESAKKPMERLSGDQKGKESPAVPSRGRADRESSGRTHRSSRPSGVWTTKASRRDRKSTRLNSSHMSISYAVFCLKKKNKLYNFFCLHIKHRSQ